MDPLLARPLLAVAASVPLIALGRLLDPPPRRTTRAHPCPYCVAGLPHPPRIHIHLTRPLRSPDGRMEERP